MPRKRKGRNEILTETKGLKLEIERASKNRCGGGKNQKI